ncbi:MAG: hypothetical protein K2Z81_24235, partial [Cyanobacteria bacterium]|nr:hypothetical protein [Cyanobacteriota bacterium]
FWCLSLRFSSARAELFSFACVPLNIMENAEKIDARKFSLQLDSSRGWLLESAPVDEDDFKLLCRTAFKDLTSRSLNALESGDCSNTMAGLAQDASLNGQVRALIKDKHQIAEKLVLQQESLQCDISREIHDAAIGRLMLLKSALMSRNPLPPAETVREIDSVVDTLREICNGLAPRDLRDWGLTTVIQDMVNRLADRTNADCDFSFSDLPELPQDVTLQVFRIVQEALVNVEKHSCASVIRVSINRDDTGKILVEIWDDGRGFRDRGASGMGLSIMHERVDLIRTTYPASLAVDSTPGKGTIVRLLLYVA